MKVTLPENISEITLGQFIKFNDLLDKEIAPEILTRRKLSIFINIPYKETEHIRAIDADRMLYQIDKALSKDVPFKNTFEMNGIKFGFIPNLDKISLAEYADLCKYGVNTETLHNLMAILFRPIIKEIGETYEIMPYTGTEQYALLMKDMPLNCVNGALVFFCNLASELQTAIQKYSSEELQREKPQSIISKILDGILPSKNWQKTISLRFLRC